MPFRSKAQQRYLFSQKPELAKEFSRDMKKKDYKKLPEKLEKKAFLVGVLDGIQKAASVPPVQGKIPPMAAPITSAVKVQRMPKGQPPRTATRRTPARPASRAAPPQEGLAKTAGPIIKLLARQAMERDVAKRRRRRRGKGPTAGPGVRVRGPRYAQGIASERARRKK